jgi:predicted TPR repeat methyltransferase
VQLAPDWIKGRCRLGNALARLERPAAAAEAFGKACALDPANKEAARALEGSRKSAEAAEALAAELEKARKSTTRRQAYDAK